MSDKEKTGGAVDMDPAYKQVLDDVFDAFSMISGGEIVSLMHVRGNVTRYSPAAMEVFGFPHEYLPNGAVNWSEFLHPEDKRHYEDVMGKLVTGESKTYDITYRVKTVGGEYTVFRAVGAVIRQENGKPDVIGGILKNLGYVEATDPITVLPNKSVWRSRLGDMMLEGKDVVSLLIGIGHMGEMNQQFGYSYGNRIMQEAAWLIQDIAKDRVSVFRVDGPCFILHSDTLTRDEMAAIYDMIRYRMQRGIQVNGIKNILSASGGLISSHANDVSVDTVHSCLRRALAESKYYTHGALVDFNGSIRYENSRNLEMLDTIRNCVLDNCKGFSLLYDPVISATDEKRMGAEAILSWRNNHFGTIAAEDFLPTLEYDFIFDELGDFMLRQALRDGVELDKKFPGFLLCVNIYRIQLESNYFTETLFKFLSEEGFPPEQLSLKFTADCRFIGQERLRTIVEELHTKNILSIIDDFGTGADSILFLKNVPVDAVSLGKQYTEGITASRRDRDILDHLVRTAAACVKHINVTDISTKAVRDAVWNMPVTTMQGSYYSVPLTKEEYLG